MSSRNNHLLVAIVFFILLTVYSLGVPFFWDGTFFSEIAVTIYDKGLLHVVGAGQPDTGGFPLYSFYLACVWKILGKSLSVSHFALLPFLLGILIQYYKLAKRFLDPALIPAALLLLVCEPVFITQSMLMGYDILMVYFFLLALNALLANKQILFSVAFTFLCMSSVRGLMLGVSLFLLEAFINKKIGISALKKYIPAVVLVITWAVYHQQKTGWFFFSPDRESTHEALLPFPMMLKQVGYMAWKVIDFGRVVLWLFVIAVGIFLYRKNKTTELLTIFKIIFVPLIVLVLCMAPFANPAGHKYFIAVFLVLNIGVCYMLQAVKKSRNIVIFAFLLAMVSGNFIVYPERYGNGWDSSLKVIPYFGLRNEMDAFIAENKIPASAVGTQYPLIADKRFSHLTEESFQYKNVWSGPIGLYDYFLFTNVINTDIPEQVEKVKKEWILLKRLEAGSVYIELYKKPAEAPVQH